MEYEEIGWLLNEIHKIKQDNELNQLLRMAEASRVGSIAASNKAGNASYMKWKSSIENLLTPGDTGEVKTLFDTLKEQRKPKKKFTLFDKLRGK